MLVAIQQPEHAPWLGFFHKMANVDMYVYLDNVQFKKRYFENRNKIRTKTGWEWIVVPVRVKGAGAQVLSEVVILDDHRWKRKYMGRLLNSYRHSPYAGALLEWITYAWLSGDHAMLVDLNLSFIEHMRSLFCIETPTVRASSLATDDVAGSDLILALCRAVGATTYLSGPDGRTYLETAEFERCGIDVHYHDFQHPRYEQMHGEFMSHMSVIDVLANMDVQLLSHLLRSAK